MQMKRAVVLFLINNDVRLYTEAICSTFKTK